MPLSPERRTQLDGIVLKMAQQNAPKEDVEAIVNDFKSKFGGTENSQINVTQPKSMSNPILDAGVGFGKGIAENPALAASLGSNIGKFAASTSIGKKIGQEFIQPLANKIGFTPELAQQVGEGLDSGITGSLEDFKAKGGAEQFGKGAEKVAEFVAPMGAVGRFAKAGEAALGTSKLSLGAQKLATGLGAGEKVASTAGKATGYLSRLGARSATEGAVASGQTALQTGGDAGQSIKSGLFTAGTVGVLGPVGSALNKIAPGLALKLEKTNLRLTPTQKSQLGSKIDEAAKFITENKIVGTPEGRLDKIDKIYEATEDTFQKFIKNAAKDRTVPREKLIGEFNALRQNFVNDADSLAIDGQIDGAIETLRQKFPDQIDLDRLNQYKRSVFKNAYNTAGTKVRDDVEFALGDVLNKNLQEGASGLKIGGKDISQFNRRYSTIINAKKLLKAASGRKELGPAGRILSTIIGASIGTTFGGPIGSAVGAVAGEKIGRTIIGTPTRSAVASSISNITNDGGRNLLEQAIRASNPLLFPKSQ